MDFLVRLAFLADIFAHVNSLNVALQGRDRYVFHVKEDVSAFVRKLRLFRERIQIGDVTSYDTLSQLLSDHEGALHLSAYSDSLTEYLDKIINEFNQRFPDLDVREYDAGVRFPFRAAVTSLPGKLAEQLIQLQSNAELKVLFGESELAQF